MKEIDIAKLYFCERILVGLSGHPSSYYLCLVGLSVHAVPGEKDAARGRLQAMLEARGFPPHLAGVLGPRVHHLILDR